MTQPNVQARSADRATGSIRLFKDLHATLRGEDQIGGHDPSLSGVFRRFAQSARGEGISAERVVIALKRAYRAWVPERGTPRDEQLPRLITASIESYFADDRDDVVDAPVEPSSQPPLDAA